MRNYTVKFNSISASEFYAEHKARITYWAIADVSEHGNIIATGHTLDEFFDTILPMCGRFTVIDLNFYGHFLLYWLYEHGYKFNRKLDIQKSFDVWVNDVGAWYSLRAVHKKKNKKREYSEFVDAKQKLVVPPQELPSAFGLPYNIDTPELEVKAVAQALYKLHKQGMRGITLSADCFKDYINTVGEKPFRTFFPILPDGVNDFVQQAYTGGYNYIAPKYINKIVLADSYDINSMYSFTMSFEAMPCGQAIQYRGKPPNNGMLFVHRCYASFALKDGYLPTLKLRDRLDVGGDYLIQQDEPIELTLTSIDYYLFIEHYNIITIEHEGGYAFAARFGLFDEYVKRWYDIKQHTTDPAQRTIAKHHLNHLYGVFGRSKTRKCKTPKYSDGIITWHSGVNTGKFSYMPLAAFVTAYARARIIRTAQGNYDRFICAATDSIKLEHVPNHTKPPRHIHLSNDIGYFKCEYEGAPFKILKTNTYAYITDGKLNIVASGMTAEARQTITNIDQFTYDLKVQNLMTLPVYGGAIKIRQDLILSA